MATTSQRPTAIWREDKWSVKIHETAIKAIAKRRMEDEHRFKSLVATGNFDSRAREAAIEAFIAASSPGKDHDETVRTAVRTLESGFQLIRQQVESMKSCDIWIDVESSRIVLGDCQISLKAPFPYVAIGPSVVFNGRLSLKLIGGTWYGPGDAIPDTDQKLLDCAVTLAATNFTDFLSVTSTLDQQYIILKGFMTICDMATSSSTTTIRQVLTKTLTERTRVLQEKLGTDKCASLDTELKQANVCPLSDVGNLKEDVDCIYKVIHIVLSKTSRTNASPACSNATHEVVLPTSDNKHLPRQMSSLGSTNGGDDILPFTAAAVRRVASAKASGVEHAQINGEQGPNGYHLSDLSAAAVAETTAAAASCLVPTTAASVPVPLPTTSAPTTETRNGWSSSCIVC